MTSTQQGPSLGGSGEQADITSWPPTNICGRRLSFRNVAGAFAGEQG